jgi:hypothetical protein
MPGLPQRFRAGFARWRRRRQDRKRKREQYRGLTVAERLDYATTEQQVRDAVIDFNANIVRRACGPGARAHLTPLLNPDDTVKEWQSRRRGPA